MDHGIRARAQRDAAGLPDADWRVALAGRASEAGGGNDEDTGRDAEIVFAFGWGDGGIEAIVERVAGELMA